MCQNAPPPSAEFLPGWATSWVVFSFVFPLLARVFTARSACPNPAAHLKRLLLPSSAVREALNKTGQGLVAYGFRTIGYRLDIPLLDVTIYWKCPGHRTSFISGRLQSKRAKGTKREHF